MKIMKIKLTKHQIKQLQPLQAEYENAYQNDEPGALVGQFYPEDGYFKCIFCKQKQALILYAAFKGV